MIILELKALTRKRKERLNDMAMRMSMVLTKFRIKGLQQILEMINQPLKITTREQQFT